MSDADDVRPVRPNGLEVRGRRHARGWSPRDLIDAIGAASHRATGVPETITPSVLAGVEEQNEAIPFATLRLIAGGLDCNPIDLLLDA
jgi:DNA-binding Xre family transcriptional regulator